MWTNKENKGEFCSEMWHAANKICCHYQQKATVFALNEGKVLRWQVTTPSPAGAGSSGAVDVGGSLIPPDCPQAAEAWWVPRGWEDAGEGCRPPQGTGEEEAGQQEAIHR